MVSLPEMLEQTLRGFKNRGQTLDYAVASMGLQFDKHLLSAFISNNYARLLLWDKQTAVFTERIDYTQEATYIMELFHRYSNTASGQRRFSPTVSEPSEEDL